MNKLLPTWLTTILLAILLTSVSYKLVVRGVICWRQETTEHAHELDGEPSRQPLLSEHQDEAPDGDFCPKNSGARGG